MDFSRNAKMFLLTSLNYAFDVTVIDILYQWFPAEQNKYKKVILIWNVVEQSFIGVYDVFKKYPLNFSKCVNNVNYNINCVILSKLTGSNFVQIILQETNENERN